MLSSIPDKFCRRQVMTKRDLDLLVSLAQEKSYFSVTLEKDGVDMILITINTPGVEKLDGLTAFQAIHQEGRWWNVTSDSRFL